MRKISISFNRITKNIQLTLLTELLLLLQIGVKIISTCLRLTCNEREGEKNKFLVKSPSCHHSAIIRVCTIIYICLLFASLCLTLVHSKQMKDEEENNTRKKGK
jgi:hypothetical protein